MVTVDKLREVYSAAHPRALGYPGAGAPPGEHSRNPIR